MAFATYFGKNLQAASFLLQGVDSEAFKQTLSGQSIGIAFGKNAVGTAEGRATLDLLTRLCARLYPALAYIPLDAAAKRSVNSLKALAQAINPDIGILGSSAVLTQRVVVGSAQRSVFRAGPETLFVGSDNWLARVSRTRPVGCGRTRNPFGAGTAACIAAANLFRRAFADRLPNAKLDHDATFSALAMSRVGEGAQNPPWQEVELGELFLVGCGAIGNGFLWAFHEVACSGTLLVVDGETLDDTNPQRYAMTVASDIGKLKVELAKEWLKGSKLRVESVPLHWEEHVASRASWMLDRLAVAVDTERARIDIQASVPRAVHNSWTQRGEVGVSRHGFGGSDACMACLYMPSKPKLNLDQLVLLALRLPEALLNEVRRRLDLRVETERAFLELISTQAGIPLDQLAPFENQPLLELYQRGVCGGVILALRDGDTDRHAEVPMAFQSAFAGVLLAADVFAEIGRLRARLPTMTQINLLGPLPELSPSRAVAKGESARCLCADADFAAAYESKYNPVEPAKRRRAARTKSAQSAARGAKPAT